MDWKKLSARSAGGVRTARCAQGRTQYLEKQDKVKERQADLDKAVTEGKGEKKIAKLQRKLGEAKEELAQAVAKRDALAQ